jgi:ABC-type sugar transport system permease subunit
MSVAAPHPSSENPCLPYPCPDRARLNWPRGLVVTLTCIAIFLPLLLIFYQSFLSAPFFMPTKVLGLDAYQFIFDDSGLLDGLQERHDPRLRDWPPSPCRWAACWPS